MDTVLFKNQFVTVIDRNGYIFLHESRSGGKLIALVPFRRTSIGYEFLARVEICPAHGSNPGSYSITGGVDLGKEFAEMAQVELLEETGYQINRDELIFLGELRPSKSADTIVFLFSSDLTEKTPQQPTGDGSLWEMGASTEWVTYDQGLQIQDPLFIAGMARVIEYLKR